MVFCQTLGYNHVMLRCDHEPSVFQLQPFVAQARQQMGLRTQDELKRAHPRTQKQEKQRPRRRRWKGRRNKGCQAMRSLMKESM